MSECQSWCLSYSKDSGISFDTNISSISSSNETLHQFQSTKLHSDDSCSHLSLSHLSSIKNDEKNLSNFDVTAWFTIPTSFECCHCHCHHHVKNVLRENENENEKYLYYPHEYDVKQSKNQVFPFIF